MFSRLLMGSVVVWGCMLLPRLDAVDAPSTSSNRGSVSPSSGLEAVVPWRSPESSTCVDILARLDRAHVQLSQGEKTVPSFARRHHYTILALEQWIEILRAPLIQSEILPPAFASQQLEPGARAEMQQLERDLLEEFKRRQREETLRSVAQCKAFLNEVKAACLVSKNAADLEPYSQKARQLRAWIGQGLSRTLQNRMIDGAETHLQGWGAYWQAKENGHVDSANSILEQLALRDTYPLFTLRELQTFLLSSTVENSTKKADLNTWLSELKTPKDLEPTLQNLNGKLASGQLSSTPKNKRILIRLDELKQAWIALQRQDDASAYAFFDPKREGVAFRYPEAIEKLNERMLRELTLRRLNRLTGISFAENTDMPQAFQDSYAKLVENRDYAKLVQASEAQTIYQKLPGEMQVSHFAKLYLSALDHEKANEWDQAVEIYRRIAQAGVPLTPVEDSLKNLSRIAQSHPEVLLDSNVLVLRQKENLQRVIFQTPRNIDLSKLLR